MEASFLPLKSEQIAFQLFDGILVALLALVSRIPRLLTIKGYSDRISKRSLAVHVTALI